MKLFFNLFLPLVLLLCSGAAVAQTPDGDPPSGEGICDSLTGDAFGLCNAYCEAMDCDSPDAKASERACERKFQQFEGLTGEAPPCAGISCPCNNANDFPIFASFASGDAVITGCTFNPDTMIMTVDADAENAEILILAGEDPTCSSTDPDLLVPMVITEEQALECLTLLTLAVEASPLGSTDACGS